jgi:hypothetical protein
MRFFQDRVFLLNPGLYTTFPPSKNNYDTFFRFFVPTDLAILLT